MPTQTIPILDLADHTAAINNAVATLNAGQLVVLPTETAYCTFALLQHRAATARLRQLLPSLNPKPFTIHLPTPDQAPRFLGPISLLAHRMIAKLWPGPVALTLQVPPDRRREIASQLAVPESDLFDSHGFITLRCPDHIVTTNILSHIAGPAVATAAPADPSQLDGKVPLILDAGPARYPKPPALVKVVGDSYQILRTGLYDHRLIAKLLRTTILFLSSSNTCRSPMSEALAKHILAIKLGVSENALADKHLSVLSAGVLTTPDAPAAPTAVAALRGLGIDLTLHRSRPLSVELIHQADIIFTMDNSHRQAVLALVPSAADKTVPLDPNGEIDHPIASDQPLYRQLALTLQKLLDHRLQQCSLI